MQQGSLIGLIIEESNLDWCLVALIDQANKLELMVGFTPVFHRRDLKSKISKQNKNNGGTQHCVWQWLITQVASYYLTQRELYLIFIALATDFSKIWIKRKNERMKNILNCLQNSKHFVLERWVHDQTFWCIYISYHILKFVQLMEIYNEATVNMYLVQQTACLLMPWWFQKGKPPTDMIRIINELWDTTSLPVWLLPLRWKLLCMPVLGLATSSCWCLVG